MINIKYSNIQYSDVEEMIRGPAGYKEEKRQERVLAAVYKVMVPVVMIAMIYIMTFVLDMHGKRFILKLFGYVRYTNGYMVMALLMVGFFRFTIFRWIEKFWLFPRIFPIRTIAKIGDQFLYEDLMVILKIQENMHKAKDVSLNIRNGSGEVRIYMHDRNYKYIIPPNRHIPKTFFAENNIDFSWLDSKLIKFEKKYHAVGLISQYIS